MWNTSVATSDSDLDSDSDSSDEDYDDFEEDLEASIHVSFQEGVFVPLPPSTFIPNTFGDNVYLSVVCHRPGIYADA